MILYLSRNETINLLDGAAGEMFLHVRKLAGSFCLREFIVNDMRKYASCRFFCVDRKAIMENDAEFIEAMRSFQTIYSARIVVFYECGDESDAFVRNLIYYGVTDIITADNAEKKQTQIAECMSGDGMARYRPKTASVEVEEITEAINESIVVKELEREHYRFDCINIKIAVAGAFHRTGATLTAFGFASWLNAHGASVAYVQHNPSHHMDYIANTHQFKAEDSYFTHDGIDYHYGMPDINYNFIVIDMGVITKATFQFYKDCDVRLFCGASGFPHEIMDFAEGLKQVKSLDPVIITLAPCSEYRELFEKAVTNAPVIVGMPKNLFDYKTNQVIYKPLIKPYIVETNKRL